MAFSAVLRPAAGAGEPPASRASRFIPSGKLVPLGAGLREADSLAAGRRILAPALSGRRGRPGSGPRQGGG